MQELEELRKRIEHQDYEGALQILDELDEMSKDDKLNKIYSYLVILLMHLIKQEAEQRSTRSWERSIENSSDRIKQINKRRKSGGYYATSEELDALIIEAFPKALKEASYEAFEGQYSPEELKRKINSNIVYFKVKEMIF